MRREGNWAPGVSGNPGGRPKGVPNKITKEIREAYANLIHGNLGNIEEWLIRIAKDDPAKAMELLFKLNNYVLPKLNQTDVTSGGEKINIVLPPNTEENE